MSYRIDESNVNNEEFPQEITELNWNVPHIKIPDDFRNVLILYASFSRLKSLKGISVVKKVNKLMLKGNKFSCLRDLSNFVNLTFLDISENKILDLKHLNKLSNLQHLSSSSNEINLTNEVFSKKLTHLNLRSNKIVSVVCICDLFNLTFLDLSYNQIQDLFPISQLINLNSLTFDNNQVQNTDFLIKLINLTFLSFTNNQIENLEGLRSLENLTMLCCGENKISCLFPICSLFKIRVLCCEKNLIQNVLCLKNLKLKNFVYNGNPLNQESKIFAKEIKFNPF